METRKFETLLDLLCDLVQHSARILNHHLASVMLVPGHVCLV